MEPLDFTVRSQVRSGFAIPSFSQCAEELVTNSIDARATHVTCEFNTETLYCKVTDNGNGFTEEDLLKAGTRYSTSKCASLRDVIGNLRYYGYRGEALASIAELSKEVEIFSRKHDSKVQYTKKITPQEKCRLSRTTSRNNAPAETAVLFRDLFYYLPVRRVAINQTLEAENIVTKIKRLSIVHPKVSFSVVNASVSHLDFNVSKHEDSFKRFQSVFDDVEASQFLQPMKQCGMTDECKFSVEGAISTQGHESKSAQFVFINGRPVIKTKIQSEINLLLKQSDIARRLSPTASEVLPGKEYSKIVVKKAYGVYYINVLCAFEEYDISFAPEKTMVEFRDWDALVLCVSNVVRDFLKRNKLMLTVKIDENPSTSNLESKVLQCGFARSMLADNCVMGKTAHADIPFGQRRRLNALTGGKNILQSADKENVELASVSDSNWTSVFDKLTGRNIFVNLATGMTANRNPCQRTDKTQHVPGGVSDKIAGPRYVAEFVPRPKKERDLKISDSKSIHILNKKWNNPAVPNKTNEIQKTNLRAFSSLFRSSSTEVVFTKEIFSRIKVIGQVDGKFIACSIARNLDHSKDDGPKSIILFDQHAAHERIRLEQLESQLRTEGMIRSEKLEDTMTIQLKESEMRIVHRMKNTFNKHGLDFDTQSSETGVPVVGIPTLFLTKCGKRGDPNKNLLELKSLVQQLIKDEIQVYRDTNGGSSTIPRCVFEILCSHACHGAIRFGDSLTNEECRKLISDISKCQLPFQCAHGRPSLTSICYDVPQTRTDKPNLSKIKLLHRACR